MTYYRFDFDITRFIKRNISHPIQMVVRGWQFVMRDFLVKKILKFWIVSGLALIKYARLKPLAFDEGRVFFKIHTGLEFLYVPAFDGGLLSIEFGKLWEQQELRLLLRYTPQNGVCFDIGASFGWFALNIASARHATVYAFEPNPDAYAALCANVTRNKLESKVMPRRMAVGDKNGRVNLLKVDYFGSFVSRSVTGAADFEKVTMITVDSFRKKHAVGKVDSLKCDVEGMELPVLMGARETIGHYRPNILIELHEELANKFGYSTASVFTFFQKLGYAYYFVTDSGKLMNPLRDRQRELALGHNFFFYPKW